MSDIRIAPSLLSADFGRLAEEIADVESAGADLLHVDVIDGHFVPNLTLGPPLIRSLRSVTDLPFDVHLMISNAERWIEAYRDAGADWISVHAEAVTHLHRVLERIRELGAEPGVALNPATPLAAVEEVLPDCHHVLLMSVNPGFGGQAYIPGSADKARRLRERAAREAPGLVIEMDGGLSPRTVREPVAAGVSVVVAGSAIFGREDRAGAVAAIRDACAP